MLSVLSKETTKEEEEGGQREGNLGRMRAEGAKRREATKKDFESGRNWKKFCNAKLFAIEKAQS